MTGSEDEARSWMERVLDVPRETMQRFGLFAELLRAENDRQNLVSRSTLTSIWVRHIADSAQLIRFRTCPQASWLDLGTGAGFPGLVVAALHSGPVTLIESRKLRVDFLRRAADVLEVKPRILLTRAERAPADNYEIISARAFAPRDRIFSTCQRFSTENTRLILPRGRSAQTELEQLESTWQGRFRLEPSVTDPDAWIIVAEGVRRTRQGKQS